MPSIRRCPGRIWRRFTFLFSSSVGDFCLWFVWESAEKAVRAAHDPIKTNYLIHPRATRKTFIKYEAHRQSGGRVMPSAHEGPAKRLKQPEKPSTPTQHKNVLQRTHHQFNGHVNSRAPHLYPFTRNPKPPKFLVSGHHLPRTPRRNPYEQQQTRAKRP